MERVRSSIRSVPGAVFLVAAIVAVVVAGGVASGAGPRAWKKVIVKNGATDPVPVAVNNDGSDPIPVSSEPPALRTGSVEGSSGVVPEGVVVTDIVIWRMSASCGVTLTSGDEPLLTLAPEKYANDAARAELHLESGIPSTAEKPLAIQPDIGVSCLEIRGFWSGYEG